MANNDHLKIPQKFWLVISSAIISGVIAFTTLTMKVNAMENEGVKLRLEYETTTEVIQEIRDSQIRTEEFIKLIKNGKIRLEE